jgi:hypothetical protein
MFIIINTSWDESACGRWTDIRGGTEINMEKISHDNRQHRGKHFSLVFLDISTADGS